MYLFSDEFINNFGELFIITENFSDNEKRNREEKKKKILEIIKTKLKSLIKCSLPENSSEDFLCDILVNHTELCLNTNQIEIIREKLLKGIKQPEMSDQFIIELYKVLYDVDLSIIAEDFNQKETLVDLFKEFATFEEQNFNVTDKKNKL